jgi:ASC-1-like (ASCH) protein
MTGSHLVILKKPYLDLILTGQKTVESRFMKAKAPPFDRVKSGDKLFFKLSSGPVCAIATAEKVKSFENLTTEKLMELKRQYNHLIKAEEKYWQAKADSRVGFLVWLKDVRRIKPVRINKKDWRSWVILTEQNNFGLYRVVCLDR